MSIEINVEASNKSVREYLRGIIKAMEETYSKQPVLLVLTIQFKKPKKKDC